MSCCAIPTLQLCLPQSTGGLIGRFTQQTAAGVAVDITAWTFVCKFSTTSTGAGTLTALTVANGGLVIDAAGGTVDVYLPQAVAVTLTMGTTYYGDLKVTPDVGIPFVAFDFQVEMGAVWA